MNGRPRYDGFPSAYLYNERGEIFDGNIGVTLGQLSLICFKTSLTDPVDKAHMGQYQITGKGFFGTRPVVTKPLLCKDMTSIPVCSRNVVTFSLRTVSRKRAGNVWFSGIRKKITTIPIRAFLNSGEEKGNIQMTTIHNHTTVFHRTVILHKIYSFK